MFTAVKPHVYQILIMALQENPKFAGKFDNDGDDDDDNDDDDDDDNNDNDDDDDDDDNDAVGTAQWVTGN